MTRNFTIATCTFGRRRWAVRRDLNYLMKFHVDLIYVDSVPGKASVLIKWAKSRDYTWTPNVLISNKSCRLTPDNVETINTTPPIARYTIPLPYSNTTAFISSWVVS